MANKLCDYKTGDTIRDATDEETRASIEAAESDGGRGVIEVDGRSCYVEGNAAQPAVKFTRAAQLNIEETGIDWRADVAAMRAGHITRESLYNACLDGADEDRVQGWVEYVDAIVDAARTETR